MFSLFPYHNLDGFFSLILQDLRLWLLLLGFFGPVEEGPGVSPVEMFGHELGVLIVIVDLILVGSVSAY